jgi:uncharacterized protein (DUF1501 family)
MTMDRRSFLKSAPLITAAGLTAPAFLARAAEKAKPGGDRILVVVELGGGNDALNTVVPHSDPLYKKARPTLAIPKRTALRIDDSLGLHPEMRGMANMLERKQLAIVLGVGYPSPNRSHFESMDVWQSADPRRVTRTGWLGRATPLIKMSKESGLPAVHAAAAALPLALRGGNGVVSVNDPTTFSLQLSGDPERSSRRKKLLAAVGAPGGKGDLADFVRSRQAQSLKGVEAISRALDAAPDDPAERERRRFLRRIGRGGSDSPLGDQLELVARLIRAEAGARIYYASMDGFDTHAFQAEMHGTLLRNVSSAVEQFFANLRGPGLAERVVLLTYTEFGRRVRENGSQGTDHGAAGHLFVAGPSVKAGLVGKYPRLDDLDDGDMKYAIDFRRVYATLLDNWLGVPSKDVLPGTFEHLPLLAKA